ncbi:MAG TPA: efflux RND transporter periplasmic adaptor subunit [Ktedonobacteraceae bacterium]|nr:efflux RND transporter periplasmic adaptor subunit [Ktedonobacteraceae bacterium]
MSDTLKTNSDSSDVDVDASNLPDATSSGREVETGSFSYQDQSESDIDTNRFQSLFPDEEDDGMLVAPPHRRRRLWSIVGCIVLLLILLGGGVFYYMQHTNSSQVQYTTVPVTTGNLTQTVSTSGPLQAKAEYDMNFSISGQISVIDVHVGQQVKAGQVLAEVNAPNQEIAVEQAQLTVNNAQSTYNTAVSNGDAQTTLDADYSQLQSAELQLQSAKNSLAAATLTAPGNAVVAAINGVVGQTTGGGGSSTSSFIVLLDTSGFTITAAVNEADVANVQVNQPVRFTVTAYPSLTFRATVSGLSIVGTTTSGVVSYPVTLTVNMGSIGTAHLYPGMTATASITTAQRIGALLVSNSAFTFPTTALQAGVINRSTLTQGFGTTGGITQGTGSAAAGSRHVVLVLRNGKLVPVLITTGLTNGTVSEVLSGLNAGDQVVVGATGGAFANVSTGSSTTGGGLFRTGGGAGGFGGGGAGGTRPGARSGTGG